VGELPEDEDFVLTVVLLSKKEKLCEGLPSVLGFLFSSNESSIPLKRPSPSPPLATPSRAGGTIGVVDPCDRCKATSLTSPVELDRGRPGEEGAAWHSVSFAPAITDSLAAGKGLLLPRLGSCTVRTVLTVGGEP
jgi:hypothetical protein